jgi:hypothetical protein
LTISENRKSRNRKLEKGEKARKKPKKFLALGIKSWTSENRVFCRTNCIIQMNNKVEGVPSYQTSRRRKHLLRRIC